MFKAIRDSYWVGVAGRFLLVFFVVGAVHFAARPVSYWASSGVKTVEICENALYGKYCYQKEVALQWYDYVATGWVEHIMYHVVGAVLAFVVGLLLVGVVDGARRTLYYVMDWEWSTYVDPCRDPSCPCPRHAAEREQAAVAQRQLV